MEDDDGSYQPTEEDDNKSGTKSEQEEFDDIFSEEAVSSDREALKKKGIQKI